MFIFPTWNSFTNIKENVNISIFCIMYAIKHLRSTDFQWTLKSWFCPLIVIHWKVVQHYKQPSCLSRYSPGRESARAGATHPANMCTKVRTTWEPCVFLMTSRRFSLTTLHKDSTCSSSISQSSTSLLSSCSDRLVSGRQEQMITIKPTKNKQRAPDHTSLWLFYLCHRTQYTELQIECVEKNLIHPM